MLAEMKCPIPVIPNGRVSSQLLPLYQETATVICDTGYKINGTSTITCQDDRSFGTLPTCISKNTPFNFSQTLFQLIFGMFIPCINWSYEPWLIKDVIKVIACLSVCPFLIPLNYVIVRDKTYNSFANSLCEGNLI